MGKVHSQINVDGPRFASTQVAAEKLFQGCLTKPSNKVSFKRSENWAATGRITKEHTAWRTRGMTRSTSLAVWRSSPTSGRFSPSRFVPNDKLDKSSPCAIMFHNCADHAPSPTKARVTVSGSGIPSKSTRKVNSPSLNSFSRIMAKMTTGRPHFFSDTGGVATSVSTASSSSRAEKRFLFRFFRFFRGGTVLGTEVVSEAMRFLEKLWMGSSNWPACGKSAPRWFMVVKKLPWKTRQKDATCR